MFSKQNQNETFTKVAMKLFLSKRKKDTRRKYSEETSVKKLQKERGGGGDTM